MELDVTRLPTAARGLVQSCSISSAVSDVPWSVGCGINIRSSERVEIDWRKQRPRGLSLPAYPTNRFRMCCISQVECCLVPKSRSADRAVSTDRLMLERVHLLIDLIAEKFDWLLIAVVGVGNVTAALLSVIAGSTWPPRDGKDAYDWWSPTHHTLWLIVGMFVLLVASTAAGVLLDLSRKGQSKARIRAGVLAQEGLREAILPSLRSLTHLSDLPSSMRDVQLMRMAAQVLMARATVFAGKEGVRMVIYEVKGSKRGSRSLEPLDFAGRSVSIPTGFEEKEPGRGAKVFKWLSDPSAKTRFVADCEKEADPDWAGTGNGYRTYISVPIQAKNRVLGMLTVDAPKPGDLDETDIPMVEVLAQTLATAFVVRSL